MRPRVHLLCVVALLGLSAGLAITSLLGDSITYDEVSKLTAGMSALMTGDYRLAADHPPLGRVLPAVAVRLHGQTWLPPDDAAWRRANVNVAGRRWLFELNDGERLVRVGRLVVVLELIALCGVVYWAGRRVFGARAGLLALVLAVLSPTLLAHGRLVTLDVPIALALLLVLVTFARLLECITPVRVLLAAAALGAASVTKMSWPLALPALIAMGIYAVVCTPPLCVAWSAGRSGRKLPVPRGAAANGSSREPGIASNVRLSGRAGRIGVLFGLALLFALTTWLSIWTAYGWRWSMLAAPPAEDPAEIARIVAEQEQFRREFAPAWAGALYNARGEPQPGFAAALLRFAGERGLLPEAYVVGLAMVRQTTSGRASYFCGEYSDQGFAWYFPVAFAIKAPIATMALLIAGLVALVLRRRTRRDANASTTAFVRDPLLLVGLIVFVITYAGYVGASRFHIGHRLLLPIYPALFVLSGAAAHWLRWRTGRIFTGGAFVWLLGANLFIRPHYLAYFNELIGGPRRGHLYLADSNIDWGQDLWRLKTYAAAHPEQPLKLSYFGAADPHFYGFPLELLPSSIETGSIEPLPGGGTYVLSVTNLLGVYIEEAQPAYWADPRRAAEYARHWSWFAADLPAPLPPGLDAQALRRQFEQQRWGRFLFNLRQRPPDERVGYSMFVYLLTAEEIERLTIP